MSHAVQRILIRARTDLKLEVEQPFWIVFFVSGVIGTGQCLKSARQTVWSFVDPNLVVISSVRIQLCQFHGAGVVMPEFCRAGLTDQGELVSLRSVVNFEFSRVRRPSPDNDRMSRRIPQHRPMSQANWIAECPGCRAESHNKNCREKKRDGKT